MSNYLGIYGCRLGHGAGRIVGLLHRDRRDIGFHAVRGARVALIQNQAAGEGQHQGRKPCDAL
jgi:hypothetical protein